MYIYYIYSIYPSQIEAKGKMWDNIVITGILFAINQCKHVTVFMAKRYKVMAINTFLQIFKHQFYNYLCTQIKACLT
ncbi:MAG: hypothetical protein A2X18_08515 [Bacteroidetes bacterium GWF2_40_14]|nr:MAG: hypothetical protein A2X18_08515 [Bacteroidetes bacterium GWF2_40_14]